MAKLSCPTCEPLDCCVPSGLDDYLLVGPSFLNNQVSVLFDCPVGYTCTPGVYPLLITVKAGEVPWNPPLIPPFTPLRLACCDGFVVRDVPTGISQSAYEALLQSMVDEAARRLAGCREKAFRGAPKQVKLRFIDIPDACCVDAPFTFQITVDTAQGLAPFKFNLLSGTLPPGLAMSVSGEITGTPTLPGVFTFVLRVQDGSFPIFKEGTKKVVMRVIDLASPASLPAATLNVAYSTFMVSTGATPPLVWLVVGGVLPPGLSLDPVTGEISGTPTPDPTPPAGDNYAFTVSLTDQSQTTCSKDFAIHLATAINPAPCDLGVADDTLLNSVSVADITILNSSQTFGVFDPMQFQLEYVQGCYFYDSLCPGPSLPTSCFTTRGHQLLYSHIGILQNTFTLLQTGFDRCDRTNDGLCNPQAADCTFFSGTTSLSFYHRGGTVDLKFNGSGGYGGLTRHNGAVNPTWQIRRTKKPVLNPPARVRIKNFGLIIPGLIGCDGAANQTGEPIWDGTFPESFFGGGFSGWQWSPDFTLGLRLSNKALSTFTLLYHSTGPQPTTTGCGWVLGIDFDSGFGAWTGLGGNGYDPTGIYQFRTDVGGFSLCDQRADVRAATVSALPNNTAVGNVLTAVGFGVLPSVDGVTLALNDRLLVKNEIFDPNNGIYTVTDLGTVGTPWQLTRATDADTSPEVVQGLFCKVTEGLVNSAAHFRLTTLAPITINVTSLVFTQIPPFIVVESY